MGRTRTAILGAFAAVALTAGVLAAQGIPADRSTYVTVSGPVSLPGVTLPAGTYLFRLADTQASRNVVQIFDKDRTKIFATLIAIPAERLEPSDDAVITFKETPSDRPPAVHYWYYAGEKSGQEFAYPKAQAMQIAAASGESVLSMETTSTDMDAMKSAELSRVEPGAATQPQNADTPPAAQTAQQPALPNEQPPTSQPTTTQSETPRPETQPSAESTPPAASAATRDTATAPMTSQQTPRPTGTSGRSELPRTASQGPLVGLMGFLALGAALGLHVTRRVAASHARR